MRRSRRGGHSGPEFGGSGEDSFVAVVVTKLTGALLFILLLTMVIMALIPKAVDQPRPADGSDPAGSTPLEIATPADLPEAIAGRPYAVALAAVGGSGTRRWAVDGPLPEGLAVDPVSGLIQGTPEAGTPEPAALVVRVTDGSDRTAKAARLVVYKPDGPLSMPSRWAPGLPPIPWRAWIEQGFGFLLLGLVHLVGLNAIGSLERRAIAKDGPAAARGRFVAYKALTWAATLASAVGLAAWLARAIG